MITRRASVQFTKADLTRDWEADALKDVNLGENNDTFGIVVGIDMRAYEDRFNWTHNPYVRANVYELESVEGAAFG